MLVLNNSLLELPPLLAVRSEQWLYDVFISLISILLI